VIRVFLSYASEDRARVKVLYEYLGGADFQPWMDKHDLTSGEVWKESIERRIQSCDCFLSCISSQSVLKDGVLADELRIALEWKKKRGDYLIIPVRLEDIAIPDALEHIQWFNYFRDEQWPDLAKHIRQKIRRQKVRRLALRIALVVVSVLAAGIWWLVDRPVRWPPGPVRVGVTLWLLRDPTAADRTEGKLVPERTKRARIFAVGERVRASFESAQPGYLYVIDREQLDEGALGTPKLIFPTRQIKDGHNEVRAGQLIEIPSQQDEPPFWELQRQGAGYNGESLTILFAKRAIAGLEAGERQRDLDDAWFRARLKEWDAPVAVKETFGGTSVTPAEIEAGKNWSKTLTHGDPMPQTVFSGIPRPGGPLVATFPVVVSR
jgi:hypothetical protein